MTNPIVVEHNVETGEIINREMTEQELKASLAGDLEAQEWRKEIELKAIAKAALLEKLGISEDEAKLLLS